MSIIKMYMIKMLGYMIVALPFYIIGRVIFLKKKKKRVEPIRELILALFVLYIIGLASQTIIPRWNAGILGETGEFYFDIYLFNEIAHVNLIPFHTISQYFFTTNANVDNWSGLSLINIAGNIFVFSPIGVFVPILWSRLRSLGKIFLLGLGVTCFIEFVQLFIGRSTDIDDVLLNTIGVVIGYGIYSLLKIPYYKVAFR
ncbi:VanZ family protein [Bacillus sp. FJAT-49732]|uniref:VanZ family protein n=1 Tax=Lederbergia citrisecunda TaxID=2833583 RepID=A0A942TQP1_9BACI|nr:VanZ family protein [Lederbergia citrisecunda]MBS4201970.1 VanZ family protein [Lederbergia citrisecunda]